MPPFPLSIGTAVTLACTVNSLMAASLTIEPAAHELELRLQPGQESAQVHYRLHNSSASTLTIDELRTTCGCGQASIDSTRLAAAAEAVITLSYHPGDRTGTQRHLLLFTAQAGDDEPEIYRLPFTAIIPEPFRLSRSVAFWRRGGAKQAITIQVQAMAGSDKQPTGLELPEGVQAHLEPAGEGAWTLHVQPLSTDEPLMAKLHILTNAAAPDFQRLPVTVLIK